MELRLASVTKRYGAGAAVDGIDLTFASGTDDGAARPVGLRQVDGAAPAARRW